MRMTLRAKVTSLTVVCAVLIGAVVTAINISSTMSRSRERIAAYRETLVKERRQQIQTAIYLAVRVLERLPADQALKAAADMQYGPDGYIWIADYDNVLLVHPDPTMVGVNQTELKDPNGIYILKEINKVCRMKGEGFVSYLFRKPGLTVPVPKITFAREISSRKWIVGTGAYVDDVEASVAREEAQVRAQAKDSIIRSAGIAAAMALGLVLGAMLLIRRYISGPVEAITQTMKNFNNDLTLSIPVTTKDEIAELTRWINDHIQKLHQIISLVSEVTGKIYINGGTIASTVENQASFTTELSSSAVEMSATMEELSTTATQIAQHSQGVAARADKTLEDTRHGAVEVESLAAKISNINQGIHQSMTEIVELGRKSSEINKVMEIINNIANQTKLIAFNAALEAASAGESGKRFGVVALEIRRLADSVVESTAEIEGRITEILDAVNRLVMSSERSSHLAEEGQEHATRTVSVLTGIVGGVEETTEAARQISISTQQQQIASGQVVLALKDIEQGVRYSTEFVRNTRDATAELAELSQKLRELVETFKLGSTPAEG